MAGGVACRISALRVIEADHRAIIAAGVYFSKVNARLTVVPAAVSRAP